MPTKTNRSSNLKLVIMTVILAYVILFIHQTSQDSVGYWILAGGYMVTGKIAAKAVGTIFIFGFLSRIFGFIQELILANYYGTSHAMGIPFWGVN